MKSYHSIYNQNPPEPVIIPTQNPWDYEQELIAEHNFEESYESQHIKDFDFMERHILEELIKYEPIKTV